MTEQTLIERAIESAKCRIYRVQANSGSSIAHQKKADEQAKLQVVTIKALEKQIAKKPKVKQLGEDIEVKCPTCSDYHMFINANRGNDYCSTCGQKLDWGNEDAE